MIWKNITATKEYILPDHPFVEETHTCERITLQKPVDHFRDFITQNLKKIVQQTLYL